MEYIPENPILEFHPDTLETVRKAYNLHRPGEMSAAVDILEEWVSKQTHFTKRDFSREYLEKCIIHAKGSLERAKTRLDKLCTMRTLVPHAFSVYNVKEDFIEYEDINRGCYGIVPKLTHDHFRVIIIRDNGQKFSRKYVLNVARLCFLVSDYLHAHDYVKGYILVIDINGYNISEGLNAANVAEIKEMIDVFKGSMDARLKAIHVMSNSKVVDMAINLFKQFISPKMASRIHVHTSAETIQNFIEKDILPVEYGGNERPLEVLKKKQEEVLCTKEVLDYMKMIRKARTDESKRSRDKFNDMYMGVSGTFRNLIVD